LLKSAKKTPISRVLPSVMCALQRLHKLGFPSLGGPIGALSKLAGIRRSDGNPNLCNRCNAHITEGSTREIGVFFADLSNYTSMTSTLGPEKTHEILDQFLRLASQIINRYDGYVSQYVGDEIMAFFNAPIVRNNYADLAVKAAMALQLAIAELSESLDVDLSVTIGIGAGHARVGRVGQQGIAHFSAIGDVVNRAARLVSKSGAGEILVDESIYEQLDPDLQTATLEAIRLKGFASSFMVARYGDTTPISFEDDFVEKQDSLRVFTSIAAIFSAPCAGYLALNGVAAGLGGGSLTMGSVALFLDQAIIRIPLLVLASGGALLIATLIAYQSYQNRRSGDTLTLQPTLHEKRRNRAGFAVSVFTLLIVGSELFAHSIMH
ncbi:MAG: adenylate/guanylate cyclase domain-containing protein, partial [Pseudomonadota bacterium]